MSEPQFDQAKAHRWFAVECNNLAWELCELPSRTADETERMLDAAHASVHHWRQVGTVLNALRGQVLLTSCYVAAGQADGASRHGQRALELLSATEEPSPFDQVSALGSAAQAMALAGKPADARRLRGQALTALAELSDEDRGMAVQLWKLVPDS